MSYKIRMSENVTSDDYTVWFYGEPYGDEIELWRPSPRYGGETIRIPKGGTVPPEWTIRIPSRVMVEMVKAFSKIPDSSDSQYRHLQDAISVRDRILDLLERVLPEISLKVEDKNLGWRDTLPHRGLGPTRKSDT
jgi:hypothetical protein